ncbi:hypothetical protein [Arthrobacter sp. EpRS71]|uniref:hypothetical protein n=1 Tax=Arthrobacter sp. EpRS71 TaxID=1743141 RepID=UPI001E58A9AB|nr:hypothetical protein [Arthrobacter sp. EpRS71]
MSLNAWLPKDDVRPVTDSEGDIDEYNRCPGWLRVVRWEEIPRVRNGVVCWLSAALTGAWP